MGSGLLAAGSEEEARLNIAGFRYGKKTEKTVPWWAGLWLLLTVMRPW
jgi:hypothetical protein